jgi:hypothetical protein
MLSTTRSCYVSSARLLYPDHKGQDKCSPVILRRRPVASRTEVSIDEGVGRQEALGLPRQLKPPHLPLSAPSWEMRILCPIVQIATLRMLDIRQKRPLRYAIASQLVGDKDARHILQTLQQPPEEALRRAAIAAALH